MLLPVATAAQESTVESEPDPVQAQQEAGPKQVTEGAAEGTPETFDPTEEISEDYSIEFPVDI